MITENPPTPTAAGPSEPGPVDLPRRRLLRGGAIVAGAAVGGAAAALLSAPEAARAADGDPVLAGVANEATDSTGIRIGGASGIDAPSLSLENENGPSLYLQPLDADFAGFMELGQVANTTLGPVIGVDTVLGQSTTFLVTGVDLADLPTPYAMPTPVRLLDTRSSAGRARIIGSSTAAFDSQHRLKAGAHLDVEVSPAAGDYELPSVYLNVVAVSPLMSGYLKVYRPGQPVPIASTLNYTARQTIANLAFVATGIVAGRYAVRIMTRSTTHVVADLTGFTVKGDVPTPQLSANRARQQSSKTTSRARTALGGRLRSTLVERVRRSLDH